MGGKRTKPQKPFKKTILPSHGESIWLLKTSIIGKYSISHPKGQFSTLVGDLIFLGQIFYNDTAQDTQWWGAPNLIEPQPHSLADFPKLAVAWNNLPMGIEWWVPKGLYGICGE
jgi:hypothetical protein